MAISCSGRGPRGRNVVVVVAAEFAGFVEWEAFVVVVDGLEEVGIGQEWNSCWKSRVLKVPGQRECWFLQHSLVIM